MKLSALILVTLLCCLCTQYLPAQQTGTGTAQTGGSNTTGTDEDKDLGDTLFVFEPVRPLIDSAGAKFASTNRFGLDILFSNSGFGLGCFYTWSFSNSISGFVDLGLTGSRNSDEFETYIYDSIASANSPYDIYRYEVPNKVNRLYTIPVTFGLRFRIGIESLADNLRPYFNLGVGPSFLVALPYQYEFFTSIGHADMYLTAGGFAGFGADVGNKNSNLGFNIRYYYIPYKPGLESLKDNFITDFGGLFLTVSFGL